MVNSNKEYKENKILKNQDWILILFQLLLKVVVLILKISISDTISNMENGSVIIKLD